jgi:class 3 adenylate cyclase
LEVAKHKGTLIKTIGDEVMCSFPSIDLAVRSACAMHIAIDAQNPGGDGPISVRIGFNYGEVIHKENDVYGDTVNVAARITAKTRARQIMTTQTVINSLPPSFTNKVRPIKHAEIRGKQAPLALFQIMWEPDNLNLVRGGHAGICEQMIVNVSELTTRQETQLIFQPQRL